MIEGRFVGFEGEGGVVVLDPFRSEAGRVRVTPRWYGFERDSTGGGCEAWVRSEGGRTLVLTGVDGDTAPLTDSEGWLLGHYADGDEWQEGVLVRRCGPFEELEVLSEWSDPRLALPYEDDVDSADWYRLLGRIQKSLGVMDGGFADLWWNDERLGGWARARSVAERAEMLAAYVQEERRWNTT